MPEAQRSQRISGMFREKCAKELLLQGYEPCLVLSLTLVQRICSNIRLLLIPVMSQIYLIHTHTITKQWMNYLYAVFSSLFTWCKFML